MMILVPNQFVKLRVNATSIDHYRSLGYKVKINETITVRADHLTDNSNKKVLVICDYCGRNIEKSFQKYIKQRKLILKDACYDCFPEKQKETTLIKYGTDSIMKLDWFQEIMSQGVKNKYGEDNVMKVESVQKKFKQTMVKRYGVEYAQQSSEIRKKTIKTLYENYGVTKTIDHPEIRKKMYEFEYVNSKKVSLPQRQIAEYFNGDLNVYIEEKFVDILLDDNIIIEYNGSGHYLSVINEKISLEDFIKKEEEVIRRLNERGFKCLIVENTKDKKLNEYRIKEISDNINKLKNEKIMTIKMTFD